ncbi:MAG: hypothetical protein WA962_14925 [Ornithinimicrobium sp.]
MTPATPTIYQITVNTHLDDHRSHRPSDVTLARNDEGNSLITALKADQARLHRLLDASAQHGGRTGWEVPALGALTMGLGSRRVHSEYCGCFAAAGQGSGHEGGATSVTEVAPVPSSAAGVEAARAAPVRLSPTGGA